MKMKCFLGVIFFTFAIVLIDMNYKQGEYYAVLLKEKTENIVLGSSTPRGRILDRNGKVLVDNEGVLNISFHKPVDMSLDEIIELAKMLSEFEENPIVSLTDCKNYYLATHNNGKDLITAEEWTLWDERKLTNEEMKDLKWERITNEMIEYSLEEQKVISLFSKMETGYNYQDKILFSNVTDDFVAKIIELHIDSLKVVVTSKRVYPYGETLRSILGTIGSIPKEEIDTFLANGYKRDDIVGERI